MKKLLGTIVALATFGFASPVLACGIEGCDCDKKAKQGACDHQKETDEAAKGCGQTGDTTADDESSETKATAKATLDIEGMSCGGCANHLASTLEDVDGVVEADVSFEDGRATVTYDADEIEADALLEAVQSTHSGKFSAVLISQSSVES